MKPSLHGGIRLNYFRQLAKSLEGKNVPTNKLPIVSGTKLISRTVLSALKETAEERAIEREKFLPKPKDQDGRRTGYAEKGNDEMA